MRNYKEIEQLTKISQFMSVTCDVCGKEFPYDRNNNSIFEIQEFTHIKNHCGYGSIFGDGDSIELDICQHCLKEKLGEYIRLIPEGEE